MVKPLVFQVSGFQNSGKTTLILDLIKRLSYMNIKTATIKHHGHGGQPDLPLKKDSGRHVAAGAAASLVEGEGRILLQAEKDDWTLEEKISLMSFFKPDLILIEGYKYENYPKAVLIRGEEDLKLLEELQQIEVVLCRDSDLTEKLQSWQEQPVFFADDEQGCMWIVEYLKGKWKDCEQNDFS
ncbi:molybdopterin-guanine dinucleotide biosynthesis protein B [Bacillus sp. T33-2]|nr:molybdopterin-guanine dinucleotide biosynthesis protein B [Bacillus sp. T33-2]